MVKWQPFKTMPEQYERLEQYVEEQNKIDKPLLSDDQLYEGKGLSRISLKDIVKIK